MEIIRNWSPGCGFSLLCTAEYTVNPALRIPQRLPLPSDALYFALQSLYVFFRRRKWLLQSGDSRGHPIE